MIAKGINILTTTCRRCGRPIATLSRSIIGADEEKATLDRICSGCITADEQRRIELAQSQAARNLTRAAS